MVSRRKQKFDGEALFITLGFGVVFGLGALFLNEFSLKLLSFGFFFGAFCGFAALPYIDNAKWKPKPKTCAVLGMVASVIFGLVSNWSAQHIALLTGSALVLGYFAPQWVKHV